MNPLKWIARRILRHDLSRLNTIIEEDQERIARLMDEGRGEQMGRLIAAEKTTRVLLRKSEEVKQLLSSRVDEALAVHDNALRPNATVKRMARILRGLE